MLIYTGRLDFLETIPDGVSALPLREIMPGLAEPLDKNIKKTSYETLIRDGGNTLFLFFCPGITSPSNRENLFVTDNINFASTFLEIFDFDESDFEQPALEGLLIKLTSEDVDIKDHYIAKIINKLRDVGKTKEGINKNQIEQSIKKFRETIINAEFYDVENNFMKEHEEEALKLLVKHSIIYQIAMGLVLRKLCVNHVDTIVSVPSMDENNNIATKDMPLKTSPLFGDSGIDAIELAFLAHNFNINVHQISLKEERNITFNPSEDNKKITIFFDKVETKYEFSHPNDAGNFSSTHSIYIKNNKLFLGPNNDRIIGVRFRKLCCYIDGLL